MGQLSGKVDPVGSWRGAECSSIQCVDNPIIIPYPPNTVDEMAALLARHAYIADVRLSTNLFLALKMGKAIFLKGEPGWAKQKSRKFSAAPLPRR